MIGSEPLTAEPLLHRRWPDLVDGAALLLVLLGVMVIAGWVLDLPRIKGIAPNFATMKVNVAVAFMLGGAALLLRRRTPSAATGTRPPTTAGRIAGALAGLVALLTLLEYGLDVNLGIDELLISDPNVGPVGIPGRMSVITAGCFTLFGAAMLLPLGGRAGTVFSVLCTLGLLVSFLSLMGYLYDVRFIYQPLPVTSTALHSAAGLVVLFIAALFARPRDGWMKLYLRPGSVGLMVRVLIPTVTLLPVLLAWLGLQGVQLDFYGPGGLMALSVTVTSLLLAIGTLLIARHAAVVDDALRDQRHLYRSVLGSSLDAFIMIDDDGRVLDWNEQAYRIFGWSAPEALGRRVDELVIPDRDRAAHRSGLARFLETGVAPVILSRKTLTARRRNGEEFAAELIIVPIEMNDRWRFGGFVRDVSEQRAVEEQLRQSQKMEAIGQLTGGIAHDLNNLLTVVIGNLDLIVSHDEFVRRHAEPARQAAERGAALVHRLLAFARRQALAPERLDLNELVIGLHELIRRTLGEEVEVELELGESVWPVFADRGQVESALLNLVVNARDAMPQGGKLTIETANAHLDDDYAAVHPDVDAGDYVMLAITDTGTGMSEDVLAHAFEPFFTTKGVGAGSGLGLSMVYGFAKQSRGHTRIYSEPGHGTTVRLYLPRQRLVAPETAEPAAVAPVDRARRDRAAGETLLVVEDDEAVREFVVAVLERLGYRVVAAGDAAEGMEMLEAHPEVDLLFTDVVLPGGTSGRQLGEAALRLRPALKVLYTSGYTRNSIVHQGKLEEGVEFLAKPYRREELAAKLRRVLERRP